MVAAIVPPTVLVKIENVALSDPAGTVTLSGTVTGSHSYAGAGMYKVRLTVTDGHAFALDRAPDGKSLRYLVAGRLHREIAITTERGRRVISDRIGIRFAGPISRCGRPSNPAAQFRQPSRLNLLKRV